MVRVQKHTYLESQDLESGLLYPVLSCFSVRPIEVVSFLCLMASINVIGTVHIKDGRAQLSLAPVEEEVKITMTRPTTDDVLNKTGNGEYTLHGSRVPLLKQRVSNMMNTIQRQLRQLLLKPGQDGAWTEGAQQRLIALLIKPKLPVKNTPLPIEDKKP